jgi:predicted ATPase
MGQLNLVTGANGTGKSSLYRALRLLGDAALNTVVASLAREGGLPSTLWAGPEEIGRRVRQGEYPVQGTVRKKPVSLKLGFAGQTFGYCIDLGYPPPPPPPTLFNLDPSIKRECIWNGQIYRRAAVLVDRRDCLVLVPSAKDEEPTILTQNLSSTDSMLATIADPQRAPEMLAVREFIRSWRFYEGFRTDVSSPVRIPQIGTFTPVLNSDGTDLRRRLRQSSKLAIAKRLNARSTMPFPGAKSKSRPRPADSKSNCVNMAFCAPYRLPNSPMGRCAFFFGRPLCLRHVHRS